MPVHEIPSILFGVKNRVSYKARQVKNSTISTWNGYIVKGTLHEDLLDPDYMVTSDLLVWSKTYLEGY
jgi:hypothetical protein